jgi:predicted metalloprotease with PDZ domain
MRFLPLLLVSLFVVSCSASRSGARAGSGGRSFDYVVSIPDTKQEMFHVEGRLVGMPADTLTIYFPIWAPGAYDLVYFGRYVRDIQARTADGRALTVIRSDSSSARIVGATPDVTISYDVHDIEQLTGAPWFGISDVEPAFAFAVGVALFGYPEGGKDIPYTVRYQAPPGWDYSVALDPSDAPNTFTARSYDELVDAPVQMGTFQKLEFTEGGKPHLITVTSARTLPDSIARQLVASTRRIVQVMTSFFGDMPYERYLFQIYLADFENLPGGRPTFGALEHSASSTYLMPWFAGSNPLNSLEPVIAHEFWHLWSPKRIHVAKLGPFDYQSPPNTSSLWFAEGLTEYYSRLLMLREKPETTRGFLAEMERDIRGFYGKPQQRSMGDLSRGIAKVGFENIGDLYSKGPVLGMLLDATIRLQTGNRKSLDDAIRYFNVEYGRTGKTFADEEIIPIMERVTGASLASFYSRYIDGVEALPIDEILPRIGLRYGEEVDTLNSLGISYNLIDTTGIRIVSIIPLGSADVMGLRAGDLLVRYNTGNPQRPYQLGRLPESFLRRVVNSVPPSVISLTYTRDGVERTIDIKLVPTPVVGRHLRFDPAATEDAIAIRRSMLGS